VPHPDIATLARPAIRAATNTRNSWWSYRHAETFCAAWPVTVEWVSEPEGNGSQMIRAV